MEYVLYLGGFLDEEIVRKRGMPSFNVAGSNRIIRLAKALSVNGSNPIIVSPATSMRSRTSGSWVQPAEKRHSGEIPVYFASALRWGFLGIFASLFFVLKTIMGIRRKHRLSAAIIYNFSPTFVLHCAYLRYVCGVPVYHNVEDVSVPRLSDWRRGTEVRPVQQLVFFLCMHLIARMSRGYIVPTRRFLTHLPQNKPYVVVTGCIDVPGEHHDERCTGRAHFFMSGKVESEHGIDVLMSAAKLIEASDKASQFKISICGAGSKSAWLEREIESFSRISIKYHGFVSTAEYQRLLGEADICVALQDPGGRYGDLKTPSKVYEYLGHGKAVISTNVGDISEIPGEVISICDPLNGEVLSKIILSLMTDADEINARSVNARQYAQSKYSYEAVGKELDSLMRRD